MLSNKKSILTGVRTSFQQYPELKICSFVVETRRFAVQIANMLRSEGYTVSLEPFSKDYFQFVKVSKPNADK